MTTFHIETPIAVVDTTDSFIWLQSFEINFTESQHFAFQVAASEKMNAISRLEGAAQHLKSCRSANQGGAATSNAM
jgi:hypothetical protein